MKKLYIFFRKNRVIFYIFLVILFIILYSYHQYFSDYYSYSDSYSEIKENCYNNTNNKKCSYFSNKEELNNYIKNNNPVEKFNKLDTITLTCEIIENNLYSVLQLVSPILIIIAVIGTLHSETSSGMFKNYLTRMPYKNYLKKNIITVSKIATLIPISLILIFLISCFITKFNFTIDDSVKKIAVYNSWKYNNFILYGIIICFVQYIMSFVYGLIGLICSFKNKSSIISIILAYIIFLIEELLIYIVIYSIIINNILGIKGLTEYFNIAGFWFFNQKTNFILLIIISLVILFVNFIIIYIKLSNKEKVVIDNEKQNA